MALSPEVLISFLRSNDAHNLILKSVFDVVSETYNFQLGDDERPYVMVSGGLESPSKIETATGTMPNLWNVFIRGNVVIERPGNRPEFKVPVRDSLTLGFDGSILLQIVPDGNGEPRINAWLPASVGMNSRLTYPPQVG